MTHATIASRVNEHATTQEPFISTQVPTVVEEEWGDCPWAENVKASSAVGLQADNWIEDILDDLDR